MTPQEYRAAIAELGLPVYKAGEALGVSPRTSQSWAAGETPVPKTAALLLRLLLATKHGKGERGAGATT